MAESLAYTAQLRDLLGLSTWRLRRDVAREAAVAAAAKVAPKSSPPRLVDLLQPQPVDVSEKAADIASPEQDYAQALVIDDKHQGYVGDRLTVLVMPGYGSWWLPALSLRDGALRLFRSQEEDDMLHAVLRAAGLDTLSAYLQRIDAHFATLDAATKRLPPQDQDLLSLPAPWLLYGAIARKEAQALASGQHTLLTLAHPLLLLTEPQQKRNAWQHILTYKKALHES